jgi:hypothetical protein
VDDACFSKDGFALIVVGMTGAGIAAAHDASTGSVRVGAPAKPHVSAKIAPVWHLPATSQRGVIS